MWSKENWFLGKLTVTPLDKEREVLNFQGYNLGIILAAYFP